MTMHVKVSGTWKNVTAPKVRVGGAWKNVVSGHVRVSGVWKQFFSTAPVVALSNQNLQDLESAPTAYVEYRLVNNGDAQYRFDSGSGYTAISGEWMLSGAVADYDCRVTLVSGTLSTGTIDTWMNLATTRAWSVSYGGASGAKSCSFTVEIRPAGGGTTLVSATITLTATVSP